MEATDATIATIATYDETCFVPVLWNEHGINVLCVLLVVCVGFMLAFLSSCIDRYTTGFFTGRALDRMRQEEGSKRGKQLSGTQLRIKWWPVQVSRQNVRSAFQSLKEHRANTQLVAQFLREHYPSGGMAGEDVTAISDSGFILLDADIIVGCVFVQMDSQALLDEDIKKWFVYCLCIHEDYRGQGLAKKLMKQLERYAKVNGVQQMQLWVDVTREEIMSWGTHLILEQGYIENVPNQMSWKTAMYARLGFEGMCSEQVSDKELVVMMRKIVS